MDMAFTALCTCCLTASQSYRVTLPAALAVMMLQSCKYEPCHLQVPDEVVMCRSTEDVEDVRREVQIMHHLAGHPNVTLLKGAYEDRHHVHLVRTTHTAQSTAESAAASLHDLYFRPAWPHPFVLACPAACVQSSAQDIACPYFSFCCSSLHLSKR